MGAEDMLARQLVAESRAISLRYIRVDAVARRFAAAERAVAAANEGAFVNQKGTALIAARDEHRAATAALLELFPETGGEQ